MKQVSERTFSIVALKFWNVLSMLNLTICSNTEAYLEIDHRQVDCKQIIAVLR